MRDRLYHSGLFITTLLIALTVSLPLKRALDIPFVLAQTVTDRSAEADRLLQQGIQQYRRSQFREALQSWQQALELYRALGDRQGEANALGNLGNAYSSLGQSQQAIELYQQNLTIAREIGDRQGEAITLGNLGNAYKSLGQYQRAIELYQQALTIAREIGDRQGEAGSLGNLGIAYDSLGQSQQAIEFQQQSLTIAREIGDRQGEAGSLGNLGIAFLQTGRLAESEQQLSNAAQVFESLRSGLSDTDKVAFFETQASTYRYWQLALIMQNKTNDALVASERGRARAFVEQLVLRLVGQPTEQNLSASIPTLEQVKQIARSHNATLVEYSILPALHSTNQQEQLFIWVVKPTGEITFKQVDLQPLGQSLADFVTDSRTTLGVRGSQFVAVRPRQETDAQIANRQIQQLQQLYNLLIQPIAQDLPSDPNAQVIFVPQGELFLVPFPALQDESGHYLIEQHTILTSPSIQLLEKTQQQEAQIQQANLQDALVVGNPTMPRVSANIGDPPQPLAALPGAEQEARAIAPLLHTQPLIGSQATKASVVQRMATARIIHLATHGILRSDLQALDSAIALAPDGTGELNDGLLTAAEIAQMKLYAELVVLSACDTAQGRITGDGVIGLSRALITAGVPSVLVSLWSVPDAPTAELMTEFYQQLQHTDNKAQALRQAMLATKAKHPSPRDWAGFTLIGEAQ